MSESILRASSRVFEHKLEPKLGANSNLNWNAYLEHEVDLGVKLQIELRLELSNSNSNSGSNAATQTRTRELELELQPEPYFGLQRALELGLELQAYLSFRCTSSQVLGTSPSLIRGPEPGVNLPNGSSGQVPLRVPRPIRSTGSLLI